MTGVVLDASAVLALLFSEPGSEQVSRVIGNASVSAVNLAEVACKLVERGDDADAACVKITRLGFDIAPFDLAQARETALLHDATRKHGLSLGDRACLALGKSAGKPVLTADRVWADANVGVEIRLIR